MIDFIPAFGMLLIEFPRFSGRLLHENRRGEIRSSEVSLIASGC